MQRKLPSYFPRKQRFWERQTESRADEGENNGKTRTFQENLVGFRVQFQAIYMQICYKDIRHIRDPHLE